MIGEPRGASASGASRFGNKLHFGKVVVWEWERAFGEGQWLRKKLKKVCTRVGGTVLQKQNVGECLWLGDLGPDRYVYILDPRKNE